MSPEYPRIPQKIFLDIYPRPPVFEQANDIDYQLHHERPQ
jgi:hypothetical protein